MTCDDAHYSYDVYAKLEDPMGVLGVALTTWQTRLCGQPRSTLSAQPSA